MHPHYYMMLPDPHLLSGFKAQLKQSRDRDQAAWERSRRLVEPPAVQATLKRLIEAIQQASFSPLLRDALIRALRGGSADRIQSLPGEPLKQLTGLPPTKAVRALCVLLGLADEHAQHEDPALNPELIEQFVRAHPNPFDLLLHAQVASVLDLGAGDLSFAVELVEQYSPRLQAQGRELILHCVDRLRPGSQLGGILQADPGLIERLRRTPGVQFQFWGNQDMFELHRAKQVRPRYTVATCYAPPTPTFAYEPTRVARAQIEEDLRRTKGEFRIVKIGGEEALEVQHRGRVLLFPPWKFEIRGPLALLDLVARRGRVAVLGAVDSQVFWELLSQLLADPRFRPRDVIFTSATIPEIFGDVYTELAALPLGASLRLSEVATLRPLLPRVLSDPAEPAQPFRFRYVEVRRGATFPGIPASRTARLFKDMIEEEPPWFLVLVPETS